MEPPGSLSNAVRQSRGSMTPGNKKSAEQTVTSEEVQGGFADSDVGAVEGVGLVGDAATNGASAERNNDAARMDE